MENEILCFSDFDNVIDKNIDIIAHTSNNSPSETLREHVIRCNKYFIKISEDKHLKSIIFRYCKKFSFIENEEDKQFIYNLFYQMVLFHDTGKVNPIFQRDIMKNNVFHNDTTVKEFLGSEHSFFSSLIYMNYFFNIVSSMNIGNNKKRMFKIVILELSYIISRHHSHLSSIKDYFIKIIENIEFIDFLREENIIGLRNKFTLKEKDIKVIINNYEKIKSNDRKEIIAEYFFIRLAYSVLVSCDYYATTEYMENIEKQYFGTMDTIADFIDEYKKSNVYKSIKNYEAKNTYKKISDITYMNDIRSHIFLETEKCLKDNMYKSDEKDNIFFLEAPTGSGKSNTAINLSFILMKNRKKLFYVYPFNTLVEQNKNTLYKSFDCDILKNKIAVVNSITPIKTIKDDTKNYYKNALLDRQFLNYPFILTTHVSFFNTLFGNRKEDIFSFLQLSHSVVVLDEIQSYKNIIWAEIIIFLKECADLMNMKIIIMSATLPKLELLAGDECSVVHLLKNSNEYFNNPIFKNRVNISYELMEMTIDDEYINNLKEHIKNNCKKGKKVLVEFIKKKSADEFYQNICNDVDFNIPIFLITGDDCIIEREKILKPIREGELKEALIIATQVIEAGVDIDMDIGYKDISILDSEEQFLGRINRSCSIESQGICYFFNYDEAKNIYRNDYRANDNLTLKNPNMQKVLEEKRFSDYYKKVMQVIKENRNNSTSENGLKSFFEKNVKLLDYISVYEHMKLIEENLMTIDIVLCRKIIDENGITLDGWEIWNNYKTLLSDKYMEYSEKQVKLSEIRSLLNNFIYSVKRDINILPDDNIGELLCIENGELYFENGKFNRTKIESENKLFI